MEEAAAADRVVVMNEGRIACEGTPEEVLTQADELAALLPDGTNGGVTADIHFRVRRVYRYDNATVAVSDVRY